MDSIIDDILTSTYSTKCLQRQGLTGKKTFELNLEAAQLWIQHLQVSL